MNSQRKPSRRVPQRGTDLETNTFHLLYLYRGVNFEEVTQTA